MKSSAAGGRAARGRFFPAPRVTPPRERPKTFPASFDGAHFGRCTRQCARRALAGAREVRSVRMLVNLSSSTSAFGACEVRPRACCDACVGFRGRVATRGAWGPYLRCPPAVAINTRRTSAPVDFGQSFAGESVRRRARGGDGAGAAGGGAHFAVGPLLFTLHYSKVQYLHEKHDDSTARAQMQGPSPSPSLEKLKLMQAILRLTPAQLFLNLITIPHPLPPPPPLPRPLPLCAQTD
ncbi:unnamed protein product, partial [Iphiclides podalirius]